MPQQAEVVDLNKLPARMITRATADPARGYAGAPPRFGQETVPHIFTVQGRVGTVSRVYRPSDEAVRDSLENARYMRNDCGVMECLESRQRGTALAKWSIVPEEEDNADAEDLAAKVTQIVERIPNFMEYRRSALEALWYGKAANAHKWRRKRIRGIRRSVPDWDPRHGDKLVFRYDDGSFQYDPDQIGIRVGAGYGWGTEQNKVFGSSHAKIEATDQGLAYFLDAWERRYMISVHKHIIEDGPWEEPRAAGSIHGIGIRSRIYWTWYQMTEAMAWMMEYLERSAFGIEIWPFPAGNANAEAKTRTAAEERIGGGRSIVLVPMVQGDENADLYMPQRIEPGMAGVEALKQILTDIFMHRIKRYIMGQILTSEAEATGLGSGVADAHLATFADIIRYDATKLEETLTEELIQPIKEVNFPGSDAIHLLFKISTESSEVEQRLNALRTGWEMGLKIRAEEVAEAVGVTMPEPGDEVLENPAIAMGSMGSVQGDDDEKQLTPSSPEEFHEQVKDALGQNGNGRGGSNHEDEEDEEDPPAPSTNGKRCPAGERKNDDTGICEPHRYEARHAPEGGVTIGGKEYKGGEFIPGEVVEGASDEERAAIEGEPKENQNQPKKEPKPTAEDRKTKADQKFEQLMAGKSLKDAEAFRRARADGIAIPPAWTDVTYYGADQDIRAEGRDAVGRKQRAENPAYRQRVSDENNARIARDLMPRMNDLRQQLRADAMDGSEEAKVLYLIANSGFRIGGKQDPRSKSPAFGASTLLGEHVSVNGNTVTFDFPGKKGVRQQHTITDPVIASMVRGKADDEPIFNTRAEKIRDAWKDQYGGAKVHDIRHVVATELAEAELADKIPPPPKSEAQRKKLIKAVATAAGAKLGNNPSQALGTYIDPQIWQKVQVAA